VLFLVSKTIIRRQAKRCSRGVLSKIGAKRVRENARGETRLQICVHLTTRSLPSNCAHLKKSFLARWAL